MVLDYIPASRRPALHAYRYSGTDQSLVSKYVLGPYWNWLVTLVPTWVAPNTVTLSGLLLVGINFATLLALDGALACGTKARLQAIENNLSATNALKEAAGLLASGTKVLEDALPADVLAAGIKLRPLLPRFGLPRSIVANEMGWGLYDLFFSHGQATDHCIPHWIYYTWAICLFAYQSLDSIDGKQARRTGMAGPLGELFDHGCDAINTTLECLLCASALNLGRSWWTVASLVATLGNFYLTTWEEYHTGTLFLSAFSGPVEGILMICFIYVLTAALGGPSFWDQGVLNVTGLVHSHYVRTSWLKDWNVPLNDFFAAFAALGLLGNVVASYSNVARARRARKEAVLPAVAGLLPLLTQIAANVYWLNGSNARIVADGHAFIPFCAFWGLSFAYNVGLLIVAHVTKAEFPFWNVAIVWSVLGAIDINLSRPLLQNSDANIRLAVYTSLGAAFLLYAHFCYHVITTITDELGTACFVVRPPKKLNKEIGKAVEQAEHEKRAAKAT